MILVFLVLFASCNKRFTENSPKTRTEAVKKFTLNSSAETLLGGSMADIIRQYGDNRIYFDYSFGLYCMVDEADMSFFFDIPKFQEYREDPIHRLNLVLEEPIYSYYYDFDIGEFTPGDFFITYIAIRGIGLRNMFGSEGPVTLDMINMVFNEPDKIYVEYDQGDPYRLAGPFVIGDKSISFGLDNNDTISYAKLFPTNG